MTAADPPRVFIIDDDAALRAAIQGLLKSVGLRSETFGAAEEFLRSKRPDGPSCLVLDVSLPGVNGLDFQRQLGDAGFQIPIIFITGHGDIPMSVRAMKRGAIEFLTKPVRDHELLGAIQFAIAQDRARRDAAQVAKLACLLRRAERSKPIALTKSCGHDTRVTRSHRPLQQTVAEASVVIEPHQQSFYPSGVGVDSDAVRPR